MNNIYLSHNNIVSAYGFDSASAVDSIKNEISGLSLVDDSKILPNPFYSSLIPQNNLSEAFKKLNPQEDYTRLEQILLVSLAKTLKESGLELTDRVGLIVSTTKGNIDVLDADSLFDENRAYLSELGKKIETFFGFKNEAIVLSNACVSGVLALAVAKRFIHQKRYDHVFVVAGDLVSQFILTGFNSFQALSELPCRPYCKTRAGINIGEVGCSVLVTTDADHLVNESVRIIGEASCNDANHISGPSRTGEGLCRSVVSAMNQANIEAEAIDYISAHGTATMFNDEMEAIAFNRANLQNTPLNSLKGYFGHTLGASGLLETIIGMYSLHSNTLFASLGFQELGVSQPLNIIKETTAKENSIFLKTASGFGGCNTAAIFQKVNS
ncbi:beta-ketoacyl synthase N-terminal-like domain-containing protein [Zobellia nedashkovskayae]|uniref:beta-ketoacyl synthase N-terminal-like domain-containing protein n=1 Tax=Zobellia nedashkovskayae TaxID=2779510 RepID=UPI00188CA2E6|nr:beta-ketoacyl synthase N-terminal-like domain-containing protein [Zobellia nedashkovskayae]